MSDRPYQIERNGRKMFVASDIGEDLLGSAYLQLKQEGFLEMMFWLKSPSLSEFLKWACARPDVIVIGGFVEDETGVQLAGLGWVREIVKRNEQKFADVGELFLRRFQVMGVTRDLASLMLDFAFEQVEVECLHGLTPRPNVPALRFMRAMGFEHTCEIPYAAAWMGQNCPAVISWMSKTMWLARKRAGSDSGQQQQPAA